MAMSELYISVLAYDCIICICVYLCSYGPGEDDGASGGISSENKPRIVLMGLRRCVFNLI